MHCYYCKALNPAGRTMCQSCGLPVTPLSGEDLADGIFVTLVLALNPFRHAADWGLQLFLQHKANQIISDLEKAIRALDEGRYEDVVKFVQRTNIKDNYPADIRALNHLLLGTAYLNLRDPSKARSHYSQLARISGVSDKFRVPQALMYRLLGDATYQEWAQSGAAPNARLLEAVQAYSRSIQYDPQNPISRRRRAQALVQADRYSEALGDLNVALQHETKIAGLYAYRALVNIQLRKLQEGHADVQRALSIDPNNSLAITALKAISSVR